MQELEGERKDFIWATHYLMTVFESVQRQQTVIGVLPHTEVESERYIAKRRTILKALQQHGDIRTSVKGYPSPVSLREGRTLVLPELYDALYSPSLMAPPARSEGSRRGVFGKSDDSSAQLAPFVTPAPAPGGTAAMKIMYNRVATFAETQVGSATEWESEVDKVVAPITGMTPTGMSNENWDEEDLDLGYHPTSEIADEPPEVDDEQIEGAHGVSPLEVHPQEGTDVHTQTADEAALYPPADDIMVAESQYGNPEVEDDIPDVEADDEGDNDYNIVVKEEEAPAQIDDQELDEDVNVNDREGDDHTTAKSVCPQKGKDAPVWRRLGTPVGNRSTTDTETGEAAKLMKSVLLGSPEGDPDGENRPRRSRQSDRESTVLSDGSRQSRGHSSDSSRSSCRSTGSKCHCDPKDKQPKDSDTLNAPETTTPQQSPCQKLIKMTEPHSQCTTSTPSVSSVVQLAEIPAQDLMHARLNDMEQRITGVTGKPSPPSSQSRRRSDTGL